MAGTDGTEAGGALEDNAASTHVTQTRWGVVAVAIFVSIIVGYAVGKVPPTIGLVSDEFGLDRITAGWLASIFFAYGAGFGVLTGMTGSRVGARALLLTGVLVLVLSGIAGALASSAAMLLAVRVFEGVSFAAIVASAPKITVDASRPEDRNLTLGIWSGYMPGGMALAMIVAPFLAEPLGWRSLWWLMAGAALIATVLAVVGTARRRWPEQPRRDADAGFDWGRRAGDAAGRRTLALRRRLPALHDPMVCDRRVAADLPDRDAGPRAYGCCSLLRAGGGHERHRQHDRRLADAPRHAALRSGRGGERHHGRHRRFDPRGLRAGRRQDPARNHFQRRQRHPACGRVRRRGEACAETGLS